MIKNINIIILILITLLFSNKEKLMNEINNTKLNELIINNKNLLDSYNHSSIKVLYLMLKYAGHQEISFEEVHAIFGLGYSFCYKRNNVGALWMCNKNLLKRANELTGYEFDKIHTNEPEEAWTFIKENIDKNKIVKVPGLEDAIIYSYADEGNKSKRLISAKGVGGPSMKGKVTWDTFQKEINNFGRAGIYTINKKNTTPDSTFKLKKTTEIMLEWQNSHPGIGAIGDSSNYGINGFILYLNDLLNSDVEIDGAYINCFAINYQIEARKYLAIYFDKIQKSFNNDIKLLLVNISTDYEEVYKNLDIYVKNKYGIDRIKNKKEIKKHINEAIKHEKNILKNIEKLNRLL
jgi:hypothetical protein